MCVRAHACVGAAGQPLLGVQQQRLLLHGQQAQHLQAVAAAATLGGVAREVEEELLHVLVRVLVALGGRVPRLAKQGIQLVQAVHEVVRVGASAVRADERELGFGAARNV